LAELPHDQWVLVRLRPLEFHPRSSQEVHHLLCNLASSAEPRRSARDIPQVCRPLLVSVSLFGRLLAAVVRALVLVGYMRLLEEEQGLQGRRWHLVDG